MAHDWQKTSTGSSFSANRGLDARIADLATRQKQLIRLEQLVALGLSRSAVRSRVDAGRLHRVHAGVLATHSKPYTRQQLWLAAVYACGAGSVLSDLPAAGIHGIFETPPLIAHVSNRTGRGRSRSGIVVHRRAIASQDITTRHGIPCTTPARTILDCSRFLDFDATEDLLMAADSKLHPEAEAVQGLRSRRRSRRRALRATR